VLRQRQPGIRHPSLPFAFRIARLFGLTIEVVFEDDRRK
jgi:DNA-binding XRE family transcriptional regulator